MSLATLLCSPGGGPFATASVGRAQALTDNAVVVTAATALTAAQSGSIIAVTQPAGPPATYLITLPAPSVALIGTRYTFFLAVADALDVTISSTVAGSLVGTIVNGATGAAASTVTAAGVTLAFVGNAAIVGDNIELLYATATQILVRAFTSAVAGITVV